MWVQLQRELTHSHARGGPPILYRHDRSASTVTEDPPTSARRSAFERSHLVRETQADEIMMSTVVHDPEARLRSYELLAQALID